MNPETSNPFVYGQVLMPGRPYCNRPTLEKQVLQAARNRQRMVLLGDRRIGKSSLVEHTLGEAGELFLTIDLRGLASPADFIDRLSVGLEAFLNHNRALTKKIPPALQVALEHIEKLRLSIPGLIGIELKSKPVASTVIQAMQTVSKVSEWRPFTVFLDEFQEISDSLEPKEANHLLGVLRAEIQRQSKVSYIFAGSAKATMRDLFTNPDSHFYQSAAILEVGAIPAEDMRRFVEKQFAHGNRQLESNTTSAIFALAGESPNDIQQLCYHLWSRSSPGLIGQAELKAALTTLLVEVGRRCEDVLSVATPSQRRALLAVAFAEDEEIAATSYYTRAGFKSHSALAKALAPYIGRQQPLLEKRGSRVRYRERFVRLWMFMQVLRAPAALPGFIRGAGGAEQALLADYLIP